MATSFEDVHGELADEHREIMGLVDSIRAERQVGALPRMLEELHRLLIDHFAHEQFPGGLYERMGARASANEELLKELVREHCTILSDVRGLLERSQLVIDADAEGAFLSQVQSTTQTLLDHEQKEHRLVERVKQQKGVAP